VRRKPGGLVPLEETICLSAAALYRDGTERFHGYQLARFLADRRGERLPAAYGTLYRALARLEGMGLLESEWEDAEIAARDNRPRRRLYRLTGAGTAAADDLRSAHASRPVRRRTEPRTA
jgi:DNA-binding PadR family transcriptional regulator